VRSCERARECLGQRREQIGQHPHQERREHHRPGCLLTQLEQADDAAALSVEAQQVLDDLASVGVDYDDVVERADDIVESLRSGQMPCDGAWPAAQVDKLQQWIDTGKPA